MDFANKKQGLTLVGLIMVTMTLVILGTAVFMWIDPVAKIGDAKDKRRIESVLLLAESISQYALDHKGVLPFLGQVATDTKKVLCERQSGSTLDCGGDSSDCLRIGDEDFYSDYLQQLPIDPDKSADTDTGYYVQKGNTGMLVVGACSTYASEPVISTTTINVSCDYYSGGYCYYPSSALWDDCNEVCADIGLECVNRVGYVLDVDTAGSPYCTLQHALNPDLCDVSCSYSYSGIPPTYNSYSECKIQASILRCVVDPDQEEKAICPCQ